MQYNRDINPEATFALTSLRQTRVKSHGSPVTVHRNIFLAKHIKTHYICQTIPVLGKIVRYGNPQ